MKFSFVHGEKLLVKNGCVLTVCLGKSKLRLR